MKRLILLVLILQSGAMAQSDPGSFEAGGYLKYLISRSSIPSVGTLTDHLLHGRLNLKWYTTETVTTALEIRARAYAGGTVEETPGFLDAIRNDHEFAHLDATLWNTKSSVGYAEVDRLWADWNQGKFQVTVGRQRVSMGTCLVWNPTDLFNPLSILDFDYEEKPAFDGGRVQYYLGPLSKLEVDARPGKTAATSTTALAYTTNAWEYDFHVLVGRRSGLGIVGGSWAGDIGGGGFRGEILVSQKPEQVVPGFYDISRTNGGMVSGAISGDYTFPNSLYLHCETLYSSIGVTENAALFQRQSLLLGLLSPSRWSLFGELSYDITPLVRGSLFTLQNPIDGSRVLVPSVTWSIVTNLDLTAIALLFHGDTLSEFGGYGESGYLRVKYSM
ncbi:MAG TPA: hypothetical protein VMM37_01595 [Bacteroidota bacterium]|nr:hypothetical protein [Bacteroidota bacterium]